MSHEFPLIFQIITISLVTSLKDKLFYNNDYIKTHAIFTENYTAIFKYRKKTENISEFEFEKFQKIISCGLYTCNIYIVTLSVWYFKQLYMFYKFYRNIFQTFLSEGSQYLSRTFNCLGLTKFYVTKSLCVAFN